MIKRLNNRRPNGTLMDDFDARRWYLAPRMNDEYMHRRGYEFNKLYSPLMPPLPCYSGVEDDWVEEIMKKQKRD